MEDEVFACANLPQFSDLFLSVFIEYNEGNGARGLQTMRHYDTQCSCHPTNESVGRRTRSMLVEPRAHLATDETDEPDETEEENAANAN